MNWYLILAMVLLTLGIVLMMWDAGSFCRHSLTFEASVTVPYSGDDHSAFESVVTYTVCLGCSNVVNQRRRVRKIHG